MKFRQTIFIVIQHATLGYTIPLWDSSAYQHLATGVYWLESTYPEHPLQGYGLNETVHSWVTWLDTGNVSCVVQLESVGIVPVCSVERPIASVVGAVSCVDMEGPIHIVRGV